jgi:hypothetical protein
MSRPLRIEFPGADYHVTSRGDRREPIHRLQVRSCLLIKTLVFISRAHRIDFQGWMQA